jgi:hypothetical protein
MIKRYIDKVKQKILSEIEKQLRKAKTDKLNELKAHFKQE